MSEKSYVANNTKYYKDSNSSEIDHVIRSMKKNKNAFEDLTKNNFGYSFDNETLDLKQNYQLKISEAKAQSPRTIQKHSNTFIDSVLAFDNKLMFEILSEENGQEKINNRIKNYMNDFKNQYGFEPVGFQFHADEGTFYTQKQFDDEKDQDLKKRLVKTKNEKGEPGYIKQNFHAQAIFLNFNKKTGKSCLRNMERKDWGDSQDLLHKHFKDLGFSRGEYKQTTSRDHKDKSDYVRGLELKALELEAVERKLILKVREKSTELLDIYDAVDGIAEDSIRYNDIRKKTVSTLKSIVRLPNLIKFIKTNYEVLKKSKIFKEIDDLKDLILNNFDIKNEEIGLNNKNENSKLKEEKPKTKAEIKPVNEELPNKELLKDLSEIEKTLEEKAKTAKDKINKATKNRRKYGK